MTRSFALYGGDSPASRQYEHLFRWTSMIF